jgi:hypothetical protein
MNLLPFHLAFPVYNISETKRFFVDIIGCKVGRRSEKWIDFNFFGHQISAHLNPEKNTITPTNNVDNVPVRHFGIVLPWKEWHALADKLKSNNVQFLIKPRTRFQGKAGEQATLFILDPSGNVLEFKSFKDQKMLFAKG